MESNFNKYRLIQTSPHGTGSTLLANIVTGLFHDKEAIHWISLKKSYGVKLKNFVTKVHKLDIDKWIEEQPSDLKLFFIVSEREKRIDDKYRSYDNVVIFPYTKLLETDKNSIEEIVNHVHQKLCELLPDELSSQMQIDRAIKRVKDMNEYYDTIKHKPMSFLNEYYHLHGSHRGRRKK